MDYLITWCLLCAVASAARASLKYQLDQLFTTFPRGNAWAAEAKASFRRFQSGSTFLEACVATAQDFQIWSEADIKIKLEQNSYLITLVDSNSCQYSFPPFVLYICHSVCPTEMQHQIADEVRKSSCALDLKVSDKTLATSKIPCADVTRCPSGMKLPQSIGSEWTPICIDNKRVRGSYQGSGGSKHELTP